MALTTYNGWPGEVRAKRLAELRAAQRAGTVPANRIRPGPCEICGQTRNTMFHAEQYGPTFEAYLASFHSLCGHCHAMIHLRFRFPNRWRWHLVDARLTGPVEYVANVGVIFARSRGWKDRDDQPDLFRVSGPEWYCNIPMNVIPAGQAA